MKKEYKYKYTYGNNYIKRTEYGNEILTESDKTSVIYDCLNAYESLYSDDNGELPNDWYDTGFFHVKEGRFKH